MLENKDRFQTVRQALKNIGQIFKSNGVINPEGEAEILLSYCLKMSRSEIYLDSDRVLKNTEKSQLVKKTQKRIEKIPLQYITKHQEFMGMDFLVGKGVLIPRPETEILVEEAVKKLKKIQFHRQLVVVDLGTGTGIIAVSLAKFLKDIIIYATDISQKSLQIASRNAQKNSCKDKIIFLQGDLFDPFRGRIKKNSLDGIVSNPPYLSSYDFKLLPPEIKDNEPKTALFGGIDGLDYYRKIISKSPSYLKKKGFVALEVGMNQSKKVEELILKEANAFQNIEIIQDYLGIERVVIADTYQNMEL